MHTQWQLFVSVAAYHTLILQRNSTTNSCIVLLKEQCTTYIHVGLLEGHASTFVCFEDVCTSKHNGIPEAQYCTPALSLVSRKYAER